MNIDELNHAWQLAEAAHRGQYYGYDADQIPYVYHLGNVLLEARNAVEHTPGCPARVVLLAAILHDTLEDTDLTSDAVKTAFGPAVLTAVQALTKNEALPKAEQMPDSLARIRAAGPAAAMVKLCDRIANLSRRPPGHWDAGRKAAYREEARLILRELGGSSEYLAARLAAKIDAY